MSDTEPKMATGWNKLSFKQRLGVIGLVLFIIQAITAVLVIIRSNKRLAKIAARRPEMYPWKSFDTIELEHGGESAQIYMAGSELFDDICAAIDAAEHRVFVETFIWIDDEAGRQINSALTRAVDRGVAVHVIYDWLLSSRTLGDGFFDDRVNAFCFRPLRAHPETLHPRNAIRDHRKIVTIDGQVAFVGGFNFGEEYAGWRDTHVRLDGESATGLENAFIDFWNLHRKSLMPSLANPESRSWDPNIIVHRNDPTLGIFPIRGMYLEAIDRASRNVWITNAYFVPDQSFIAALVDAARRGCDVRVMLPLNSNHSLTDALAHGMFEELLTAGVGVYLYNDFMVHAKTATIDGKWTTIGTANLDRWSMLGNYEINVEIRSQQLAEQMEQMFALDIENCRELDLEGWRRRPIRMKTAERALRTLSPLL